MTGRQIVRNRKLHLFILKHIWKYVFTSHKRWSTRLKWVKWDIYRQWIGERFPFAVSPIRSFTTHKTIEAIIYNIQKMCRITVVYNCYVRIQDGRYHTKLIELRQFLCSATEPVIFKSGYGLWNHASSCLFIERFTTLLSQYATSWAIWDVSCS